jgi:hypothetical protein
MGKAMKRIILSIMVMAFAVAVQAGDAKAKQTADKEKPACCAKKTQISKDESGGCPFAKQTCCAAKQQAKKDTAKQPVLLSPKGSEAR